MGRESPSVKHGGPHKHRRRRPTDPADVPLNVLVADDEALIRRALQRLLAARGHTVVAVPDAPAAIAVLDQQTFDVVLVDWNMPGGGQSVFRELAERPEFRGRKILMTGTVGADPTIEIGRDVHLVRKPFDFSAMVSEVEGGPG